MSSTARRLNWGGLATAVVFGGTAVMLGMGAFRLGIPERGSSVFLILALVAGCVAMFATMGPSRRQALHLHEGAAVPPVSRFLVLEVLGLSTSVALVLRYVLDTSWLNALGAMVAAIVYLTLFQLLARVQRHGVAPWIRPAGYGFALAGVAGALAGAAVAGRPVGHAAAFGLTGSLLHYIYVRAAMRGAARVAARKSVFSQP